MSLQALPCAPSLSKTSRLGLYVFIGFNFHLPPPTKHIIFKEKNEFVEIFGVRTSKMCFFVITTQNLISINLALCYNNEWHTILKVTLRRTSSVMSLFRIRIRIRNCIQHKMCYNNQ